MSCFKPLILIFFITNVFAQDTTIDSISFTKIKKLVEKEELIAKAYKQYIRKEANFPTMNLLENNNYLPEGFSRLNLFGKEIKLETSKSEIKNTLIRKNQNNIEVGIDLKSNIYDYYYSNKYRTHTKAPINLKSRNIIINLDKKEEYILKFKDDITKDKTTARNKYYLDPKGLLHWYDNNGYYKYTLSNDLVLDETVVIFNTDGTIKQDFTDLFANKDVLYAGQTIFHPNSGAVDEYLHLGNGNGIIKVGKDERDIGKTILQFTRRAGGIIINGDIYTWGNNDRRVVAIGKNAFLNKNGVSKNTSSNRPIITTLTRAKALVYIDDSSSSLLNSNSAHDNKFNDKGYFSSPIRPKFIDFTSDVWHSTCGVTTKGELYCGGWHALEKNWTHFDGYDGYSNLEYLYRSSFFDGTANKAKRLFGLIATWVVLGEDGYIYFWGDNNRGFAGTGSSSERSVRTPSAANNIKFKDVTYSLSIGYRRIAGLSEDGNIYTWGLDNNITYGTSSCNQSIYGGGTKNLCKPTLVNSNVNFTSILGGQQTFLATDENNIFYRISQPKIGGKATLPVAEKLNDLIKTYSEYDAEVDSTILSVDISSKLNGSSLQLGQGIVWVNGKNQLKGDLFTAENKNDEFFKASISKIKWKKIRVVEDKNGMCGIDIYNQMYCWGAMSFYAGGVPGNTFMLPVFNANLHDEDKDFLFVEGSSNHVTPMTSGDWNRSGEYFIKYPTYFGGFNYEFTFK